MSGDIGDNRAESVLFCSVTISPRSALLALERHLQRFCMATSEQSEARCPGLPSTGSLGPLLLRDTLNIVVGAGN